MSSIKFYNYSKKSLLEYALINEKIQNGVPIPFKFKERYYFYSDIYSIVEYLQSNATITSIFMKTNCLEQRFSSVTDFMGIVGLENQILYQFSIKTNDPPIEITMEKGYVNVDFRTNEDDEGENHRLDEILEKVSRLLNKTNTPNAWITMTPHSYFLD